MRCIDDIPKGAFVCTYSGRLMTEEQANKVSIFIAIRTLARFLRMAIAMATNISPNWITSK